MSTINSNSKQFQLTSIWERYNSLIIWLLMVAYLGLAAILVTSVFPASIFVYSAAAIFVEVVYRLLTIPLLLGLLSIFVRSQGAREKVFWALAILTSLIEPLTNTAASQYLTPLALAFVLVQSFAANFLQAVFFRTYGFLAAILLRVAFYIPYHVIGSFLK